MDSTKGKQLAKTEKIQQPLLENSIGKFQENATIWPQVLITLISDICPLLAGIAAGYVGVFLPDIRQDINISQEQGSWIASLPALGSIPGGLVAAWISEKFGRRRTLQGSAIPFLIGWIMIAFGQNFGMLVAGRFITGFACGLQAGSKQAYFSELFDPKLRGVLSSTAVTAANLGILVSYLTALCVSWRVSAMINAGISAVLLIGSLILPETPTWLITNNRTDEATKVLKKMRGPGYDIESELNAIIKKNNQIKEENEEADGYWLKSLQLFFSRQTMVAFGILFLVFFIQRFSGAPVINSYIKDIFYAITDDEHTIQYLIIATGVIRLISTFAANILMKSTSKKKLFAVSGFGMAVSLTAIAVFSYPPARSLLQDYKWIPAMCMCGYIAFLTLGFSSVSWVLIGELFPQRTRGIMSSVFPSVGFLLYFIATKTYHDLVFLIDTYGAFSFYAVVALVGTIFVLIILPNTEGKTLTEIEDNVDRKDEKGEHAGVPHVV